ncbi:hypothetical protein M885DRAFT_622617 [Pelagophyceae sp. CCMP2097]|nr:hypothetical protein M885DRAFT_622617 [Pelagophyceae sp. CCMP2097]
MGRARAALLLAVLSLPRQLVGFVAQSGAAPRFRATTADGRLFGKEPFEGGSSDARRPRRSGDGAARASGDSAPTGMRTGANAAAAARRRRRRAKRRAAPVFDRNGQLTEPQPGTTDAQAGAASSDPDGAGGSSWLESQLFKPLKQRSPRADSVGVALDGDAAGDGADAAQAMSMNETLAEDIDSIAAAQKAARLRGVPIKCVCGYCRNRFESRSKLFRHLREGNDCRRLALSHGMPLENPIRAVERRLRRRYGDLLLAGCIVIRVREGADGEAASVPSSAPARPASFDPERYEVVIVRSAEGKQRPGFPKGKIEGFDASLLGAALRETWEEAGLAAAQLRVLPASAVAAANATAYAGDVELSRLFNDDEAALLDDSGDEIANSLWDSDEDLDEGDEGESLELDGADDAETSSWASINVREVTGRQGKRARYFICGVAAGETNLTSVNDLDGDIADVSWVRVDEALLVLERRRRAALRRALLIYFADEYYNL